MFTVLKCWLLATLCTTVISMKRSHSVSRIVGGRNVSINDYPYQLSLRYYGCHTCGAVILSRNYALTAAHCVLREGSYTVRAGSSNVFNGGVVVLIRRALVHPSYRPDTQDYDIAILQFQSRLRFSNRIRPVALPTTRVLPRTGTCGIVSGWGTLFYGDPSIQRQLRAVEIPLDSQGTCRRAYTRITDITPRMFCAGYRDGGRDACQGDSGGPYVVRGVLYGLVSFGINCADSRYPGVYTNVANLRSYIRDNTGL